MYPYLDCYAQEHSPSCAQHSVSLQEPRYLLTAALDFPIIGVWAALVAGNVIAAAVGYVWIWSTLNKFDFKEVEETVHMHA